MKNARVGVPVRSRLLISIMLMILAACGVEEPEEPELLEVPAELPVLPEPWEKAELGIPGGAIYYEGRYTLETAEKNRTGDNTYLLHQNTTGNIEFIARIGRLDGNASAGIMLRETLGERSKYAFAYLTNQTTGFETRTQLGGAIENTSRDGIIPTWLRIIRSHDRIIAYQSIDGTYWTRIDATHIRFPNELHIGLVLRGEKSRAIFTNITIREYTEPVCGNSIIEDGQECDDGIMNGQICLPDGESCTYCSSDCRLITRPAEPARTAYSLRGDPNFHPDELTEEARIWYTRLWAAIEHDWPMPDPIGQAKTGNTYPYGRMLNEHITALLVAFRATGDLRLLDEIDRITQIMRENLRRTWIDDDGNPITPDDRTEGKLRWLSLRQKTASDYGKDTSREDAMLVHGLIATIAYAFHENRDLTSPGGVNYEERARFWKGYLKDHFEAGWRERTRRTTFPFVIDENREELTISHPWTNFIRYHHYLHRMTQNVEYAVEAERKIGVTLREMTGLTTLSGPAAVWSHGLRTQENPNEFLQPTTYARYDVTALIDLTLARTSIRNAEMERVANSLVHYVDDGDPLNTGIRFASSIGGDRERRGIPFDDRRPRLSQEHWATSNYPLAAAWDSEGNLETINREVYRSVEDNPERPQRIHIPVAMLITTLGIPQ